MVTSAKIYTKINLKIRNTSFSDSNPKSTVAPKVYLLNFGMILCLFMYSPDAGYIKVIVVI